MKQIIINPKDLPFDNKVREMCKSCKRFGTKGTCPPYTESVEYYSKLLKSYKTGILYYKKFDTDNGLDWKENGKQSSLELHKMLLQARETLFGQGHYFVVIFGAGSCKLCKECSIPCRQPNKAVMPLEATGVNIVKLMKQHKINITFPITNSLYRIGLVLYD